MAISPEMIRRIEEEVKKVLIQQGITLASSPSDKRILAIFDATQVGLARPLAQLDKCVQQGYSVTVILSDLAIKLLDISCIRSVFKNEGVFVASEITDLQPFTEGFSLIVIPTLSCAMAAKLSLGMADTPCAYLVFQAMLRRNRILAASDGFEISAGSEIPPEISKLGQSYIKTLSDFGVQFVAIEHLAEAILSDGTRRLSSVDSRRGQNIISASVIASLAPDVGEFAYTNPAIVTPLARDLAAQKGIRLIARNKNL